MSLGRTVDPPLASRDESRATSQPRTDEAVDRQLLRDAQDEIRNHVAEIVRLSKGDISPRDFFARIRSK